jgi:hypothetical protein
MGFEWQGDFSRHSKPMPKKSKIVIAKGEASSSATTLTCGDSSSPSVNTKQLKTCRDHPNVKDAVNRIQLFLNNQFQELIAITAPLTLIIVSGDQQGLIPYSGVYDGPSGVEDFLVKFATIAGPTTNGVINDIYVNGGFTQVALMTTATNTFHCSNGSLAQTITDQTLYIIYYDSHGQVQKVEVIPRNSGLTKFRLSGLI